MEVTDREIEQMFTKYGLMVNAEPTVFNKPAVISLLNSYVIDGEGRTFSFEEFKESFKGNMAFSSSGLLRRSKYQREHGITVLPSDEELKQFYNWLLEESKKSSIAVVNTSGHGAALAARQIESKAPAKGHSTLTKDKTPQRTTTTIKQKPTSSKTKGGSQKTKIQFTRKYKRRTSRKNKSYKVRRT